MKHNINNAAKQFAETVRQSLGDGAKVYIPFVYYDPQNNTWHTGEAGNMNDFERIGAANYLADMAKMFTQNLDDDRLSGLS